MKLCYLAEDDQIGIVKSKAIKVLNQGREYFEDDGGFDQYVAVVIVENRRAAARRPG